MADRRDRGGRFEQDKDFRNRAGALDRRWGYGERLSPGYKKQTGAERERTSEDHYQDDYNSPDYWAKQKAWMRPGPYTGYGPRGYRRPDNSILEDICDRLTQHAEIDAREIEVDVQEGEVTLTGTVEDRRMKRLVEANVEMIPGVVDVHNRLNLRRKPSREEEAARKTTEEMADKFPGGPTPTGNAGY